MGQITSGPQTRLFPLGKEWFVENDIDLPLPFGVSGFFAYMSRGIDISNVEVAFPDEPKQSINDFAAFERWLAGRRELFAKQVHCQLDPLQGLFRVVERFGSLPDESITNDG